LPEVEDAFFRLTVEGIKGREAKGEREIGSNLFLNDFGG
jgi:hypothetical protein